jgi:Flp pilus assembly pilin Flp
MLKELVDDESGVAVLEVVLVLVVIVGLTLIFKDQITALLNSIFDKVKAKAGEV